jgi:hypothetical protein
VAFKRGKTGALAASKGRITWHNILTYRNFIGEICGGKYPPIKVILAVKSGVMADGVGIRK